MADVGNILRNSLFLSRKSLASRLPTVLPVFLSATSASRRTNCEETRIVGVSSRDGIPHSVPAAALRRYPEAKVSKKTAGHSRAKALRPRPCPENDHFVP